MQNKFLKGVAGALAGIVLSIGVAVPGGAVNFNQAAFAGVSGLTSIPIGHAEFCKSHIDECRPSGTAVELAALNEDKWRELLAINARFNADIVPVSDQQLYQVAEFWTYPRGYGDCEDYVLAKRRELIAAGWAPSTLLMTVVREADGDGHAVLMVRTDRGDLVLDNQEGLVRVWNETPYQYLKRQSQWNPGEWVDIVDTRPVARLATR